MRSGVADGIGDVDRLRASFNDFRAHQDEEVAIGSTRIFGGELDVLRERASKLHGLGRFANALVAGYFELILEMDIGRSEEGVNAMQRSGFDGVVAPLNVLLGRATQPRDSHGDLPSLQHRADRLRNRVATS